MIQLRDIVKRYPGGHEALAGVSLDVDKGEFILLTGHSGAGKSTLLKLVAAIERPTSGIVEVSGRDLSRLGPTAIPYMRRKLGLVFQDLKLLHDRSVFENVALPLRIAGFEGREINRRVGAALDRVGLLAQERQAPRALSGGEQQRLCIARAVVHRPALILADEPTANLDDAYAREIGTLFQALHSVGTTLVVSTHSPSAFAGASMRLVALEAGRLAG